jgi:hypothetical protein
VKARQVQRAIASAPVQQPVLGSTFLRVCGRVDLLSMLCGKLSVSGPRLSGCLPVAARKDADEHQRDDDLHEDEHHEK